MSYERLASILSNSQLKLVDSRAINFGYSQTQESEEFIRQNSLSFPASDLLELNEPELFALSKEIRTAFTRVASKSRMKIDRQGLEQLKRGRDNVLVHETAHYRVITQLRPELVSKSRIHIFSVAHEGEIVVAMNVETPKPEVAYTATEKAQIQMAPAFPSDSDYYGLYDYINDLSLTTSESKLITEMVASKPKSEGKIQLTRFLESMARSRK